MKFYKLIKSIDYVTSPVYEELCAIRKEITNTINDTKSLVISIIAGLLSNSTELFNSVQNKLLLSVEKPNLVKFIESDFFRVLCPIIVIVFVYFFIKAFTFFYTHVKLSCEENKDSKEKRDILVDRFYHQIIPQLIEIKSLTEKAATLSAQDDERKKLLLYLQAKHELKRLLYELKRMQVFEKDTTGLMKKDSTILVDRIGDMTYNLVLAELLDIIALFFDHFYTCQYSDQLINELGVLVSWISDGSVFHQTNCTDIKDRVYKLHLKINKQYNDKCGKTSLCFSVSS